MPVCSTVMHYKRLLSTVISSLVQHVFSGWSSNTSTNTAGQLAVARDTHVLHYDFVLMSTGYSIEEFLLEVAYTEPLLR